MGDGLLMSSRSSRFIIRLGEGQGAVRWMVAGHPVEVVAAYEPGEVLPVLDRAESAADGGMHAIGFVTYESARAFDSALVTHAPMALPLAWFGLFDTVEVCDSLPELTHAEIQIDEWQPTWTRDRYAKAFERVKQYIASGDTYQINLTQRMRAAFEGDPYALFYRIVANAPPPYAAYLDVGRHAVVSLSPELFFERQGDAIRSRPMKGTIRRGRWSAEDDTLRAELARSEKDRAENAMIVDMIRNDLGRVAETGSVRVSDAFAVERYPTVHQMTSTVAARTSASFARIMAALFPCASVTGAPKVRSMQIIRELEDTPRGIYCGCIGYLGPKRKARFNVAIRTLCVDRVTGDAEYGTGGGVVWDSTLDSEFEECRVKAQILCAPPLPAFELLETLLWKRGRYVLLLEHMARLASSARYFDYQFDEDRVAAALHEAVTPSQSGRFRVRLLVGKDGSARAEAFPLERVQPHAIMKLAIAMESVRTDDIFLYHKTTARSAYERARELYPDADDVLLVNERGELTESTIANLVLRLDGALVTPPVSSGLLAGTMRDRLLRRGHLVERVLTPADLKQAEAVYLINSVRGWTRAEWIPSR